MEPHVAGFISQNADRIAKLVGEVATPQESAELARTEITKMGAILAFALGSTILPLGTTT
jgi:hypothetical protein